MTGVRNIYLTHGSFTGDPLFKWGKSQSSAPDILRKDIPVKNRLQMAPRLAGLLNAAFDKTFELTNGHRMFLLGPFSNREFTFVLYENREDLNGPFADKVPAIDDFIYFKEFQDNLVNIAPRHGFRHIRNLLFRDVVNNVDLEITDCFEVTAW